MTHCGNGAVHRLTVHICSSPDGLFGLRYIAQKTAQNRISLALSEILGLTILTYKVNMQSNKNKNHSGTREKLSTLWIVVMFNMAFADILAFVLPEALNDMVKGTTEVKITQELLLAMAVLVQIPIIMIYLSLVLSCKFNRWINIIAAIITISFVIGGDSLYFHYIFFASIEVICMLMVI